MDFAAFALAHVPSPPARVLEIGCGQGALALELAQAGYEVVAIDPEAPEGPIFRRVSLEDFDEPGPFATVVASLSLHHIEDLPAALDKIGALLSPDGVLVLGEFAHDRLDEATAGWFWGQRRAGGTAAPDSPSELSAEWAAEHEGLHGYERMSRELGLRFRERHFSWEPYLYRLLDGVADEASERSLIESGAIQAIGFRYVGEPR